MQPKLIVFDLAGVLVETDSGWVILHKGFDVYKESRDQYKMYHDDKIDYDQWCQMNVALWRSKDATKEKMLDIIGNASKIIKGAKETLDELKKQGFKLAVISGDIDLVLEEFFPVGYFDYVFINKIVFDDQHKPISVMASQYDFAGKARALQAICIDLGIDCKEVIAVLDDSYGNDAWLAEKAGKTIAFNAKTDNIKKLADVVIDEKDLRKIIPHLNL